jgi:hypothetical protein
MLMPHARMYRRSCTCTTKAAVLTSLCPAATEPVPALSSLDPQAVQHSAAVSFSIRRREDAFAQEVVAGGRRGGVSAARRRAESILAHRSFAMELDERDLDG